jgi:hypothetical protein
LEPAPSSSTGSGGGTTAGEGPGDRVAMERGPASPAVEEQGRSSGLTSGPSEGAAPSPHGAQWRRTATARCSLLPTRPGVSSPHTRQRRWRQRPSPAPAIPHLRRARRGSSAARHSYSSTGGRVELGTGRERIEQAGGRISPRLVTHSWR